MQDGDVAFDPMSKLRSFTPSIRIEQVDKNEYLGIKIGDKIPAEIGDTVIEKRLGESVVLCGSESEVNCLTCIKMSSCPIPKLRGYGSKESK